MAILSPTEASAKALVLFANAHPEYDVQLLVIQYYIRTEVQLNADSRAYLVQVLFRTEGGPGPAGNEGAAWTIVATYTVPRDSRQAVTVTSPSGDQERVADGQTNAAGKGTATDPGTATGTSIIGIVAIIVLAALAAVAIFRKG